MLVAGPHEVCWFQVPEALVRDIAKYWQEMEESSDSFSGSSRSEDEGEGCRPRYKVRVVAYVCPCLRYKVRLMAGQQSHLGAHFWMVPFVNPSM